MKTKKSRLLEILGDRKVHDKGNLCNQMTYEGFGYADSVARCLRKMTEDGLINKIPKKKGTEYALVSPVQTSNEIKGKTPYEVAKAIRESKETNLQLL